MEDLARELILYVLDADRKGHSPPEIRAGVERRLGRIIQAAVDQERERCARIAHDRATQWDAIKESRPDDPPATLAAADARWHEACDIAALILAP